MKLKNKVALITGASKGIGKSIAETFVKEGAKVIINYNNSKKEAEKIVNEINKNGGEAIAIKCDITKENEVENLINSAIEKFKKIDILVNNAGMIYRPSNWECDLETWNKSLDIALTGPWLVTKYAIPYLKKQKDSNIIFIPSYVGLLGSPFVMPYGAGKSVIINMMKAFARALAPDIRVNSISPGNIDTEITRGAGEEFLQKIINSTPLKRIGKPEEISKTALFLASNDASFITGVDLTVDGGFLLSN